jgi:transposase-like protein
VSDKPARPPTDWEAIEREYRAGQLSVAEIARQNGVSAPLIFRRVRKEGWTRNLAERIRQAVTTRSVTDGVTAATMRETIELAAERGVQIVREHRTLIGRGRAIVSKLFGELEGENEASLKDKSTVLGNLTGSLKTLVAMERQAFNLSDEAEGDKAALTVELVRFAGTLG